MVLVVFGDALGGCDGRVVLGSVEASHGVVHGALESDRQDGLLGLGNVLVKGEGAALILLIVADVGGLDAGSSLAGIVRDFGRVKLEFVGVESDGFGGLLDLEVNCYATLVRPRRIRLEVEEGDVVVCGLDTGEEVLARIEHEI